MFYIQDKDGKNHPLDVDQFLKGIKDAPYDKKDLREMLTELYDDFKENIPNDKKIHTISYQPLEGIAETFQNFILFYADKLSDILCQQKLNTKYVRANANPAISDYFFYNIIHDDDKMIIKGFAFCSNPTKGELYVSTVCGTGGTATIFKEMLHLAVKNEYDYKVNFIHLDSVENPDTINFYTKLGFRKTDAETKAIISDMFKSSAKTFNDYVKEGKKIVGGSMFLFPPNTEGEKALKKKKCHYIYSPNEWFDEIKKLKKEGKDVHDFLERNKKEKLEGAGLGDFFRGIYNKVVDPILSLNPFYSTGKAIVNNIDTIKNVASSVMNKLPNKSAKTLNQFGNIPIQELTVMRSPVTSYMVYLMNLVTLGKFGELKEKYQFDKMFHLSLVAKVKYNNAETQVIIEKNERVNISDSFKINKDTQFQSIPIKKTVTISELINNAKTCMGENNFYDYDAFNNNCQVFILNILQCSGLLTEDARKFIYQDVSGIAKEIPSSSNKLIRTLTTLGAMASRLLGKGKEKKETGDYELHAVIIKKPYKLEDAKVEVKKFIPENKHYFRETNNSYRFRNIPKQKFEKKTFRTKKISPNLSLIFGKLK